MADPEKANANEITNQAPSLLPSSSNTTSTPDLKNLHNYQLLLDVRKESRKTLDLMIDLKVDKDRYAAMVQKIIDSWNLDVAYMDEYARRENELDGSLKPCDSEVYQARLTSRNTLISKWTEILEALNVADEGTSQSIMRNSFETIDIIIRQYEEHLITRRPSEEVLAAVLLSVIRE